MNAYSRNMAIGLGTIFVLGVPVFQKVWANQIWLTLRAWPMLTLFIVIGLAIAGTAVLENTRSGELPKIAMVVVGLIAVFAVGILVFTPYFSLRSVDTSNTTLAPKAETAQMAEYKVRPPFVVGSAQVSDNVSINGDPQNTKYIPDSDRFGNLIVKAGVLKGYGEIVWARINESGQATTDSCRFSKDAERRLGGRFSHSLERAILNKDFGVMIDPADSYGYCDDKGTPWVVVPLKKYKGFLAPSGSGWGGCLQRQDRRAEPEEGCCNW